MEKNENCEQTLNLAKIREQIDEIDNKLSSLFVRRMALCAQVAASKKQTGKAVRDAARENAIVARLTEGLSEKDAKAVDKLYRTIFDISRASQQELLAGDIKKSALFEELQNAIHHKNTWESSPAIACQGVEGAYSSLACKVLFEKPDILYFKDFESVFKSVESGLCRYGVLPLENSTAGSVNAIYDLMMKHDFRIVRSVRLKVDHNLLVKPGAKRSDITEIYSHQQALSQCEQYLQAFPGVKIIPCENTAVAAQKVAEGDGHAAALSSRSCMKLYGLECLEAGVQDQGSNFTRFICISKNLEIYPGADRTSLMAVLPHEPGSLCRVLSRFYALGLNLNKLESRPMPERNFEFMFYFDLETPVYAPEFLQLMGELPSLCEEFSYLGSYSEVV